MDELDFLKRVGELEEAKHDELLVAILVAGARAECSAMQQVVESEAIVSTALADLAEIRRQLKGEG